jgi:hypothetical protein
MELGGRMWNWVEIEGRIEFKYWGFFSSHVTETDIY